jgi:hypothetical protein
VTYASWLRALTPRYACAFRHLVAVAMHATQHGPYKQEHQHHRAVAIDIFVY